MKKIKVMGIVILALVLLVSSPVKAQFVQVCEYDDITAEILSQMSQESWAQWIRDISGENPVLIGGQSWEIFTRHSYALFNNNNRGYAYPYLTQELINLGYDSGVTLSDHLFTYGPNNWKNLVLTIPGHGPNADEIVMLTAHLDSTSTNPSYLAPGAEDNASGVATLMEAARLFRHYQFDRTIKIIFFTGEEQGLYGSEAYVDDHPSEMDDILGVVNLDMFGYDSNQDRCFELHVGTMTASNNVGTCFTQAIDNYDLNLTYDFLEADAIGASDHASFWAAGVGAIEILENYSNQNQSGGCIGQDRNPHYHQTTDTIDKMFLPAAVDIAKGGMATAVDLASPLGLCFEESPVIDTISFEDEIGVEWLPMDGADSYLIYRSDGGCGGDMRLIGETSEDYFLDINIVPGLEYAYQVEAASAAGTVCFSMPSNCQVESTVSNMIFLPLLIGGN